MREMSNVFGGVAVMVFTGKSYFWLSILTNALFSIAFTIGLALGSNAKGECSSDTTKQTQTVTIWALCTAIVALGSLLLFT